MRLQCPKCGDQQLVDDDLVGEVLMCSGCRSKIRVPGQANHPHAAAEDDEDSEEGPLFPVGADDGRFENLVDMTAMVDIVFFLLIFFMITTAAGLMSCIGMPPPKQDGATASTRRPSDLEQDSDNVTVRIDQQNRIFVDDIEFPTEADLRERLRSARASQIKKLLVKAHGDAHNGTFVMVQDLGYDIGFEEFSLSVAKEEEQQQ